MVAATRPGMPTSSLWALMHCTAGQCRLAAEGDCSLSRHSANDNGLPGDLSCRAVCLRPGARAGPQGRISSNEVDCAKCRGCSKPLHSNNRRNRQLRRLTHHQLAHTHTVHGGGDSRGRIASGSGEDRGAEAPWRSYWPEARGARPGSAPRCASTKCGRGQPLSLSKSESEDFSSVTAMLLLLLCV